MKKEKIEISLELSKMPIALIIALGLIYPLGSYWYIGCIVGAIIFGWGLKESSNLMKTRSPVPTHKIAGPILLIIIIANLIKFFI